MCRVPSGFAHRGRGAGRGMAVSNVGGVVNVVPTCALVQEAISAVLDDEALPLSGTEVGRHLARCPACRRFEAAAAALSAHVDAAGEPSRPTAKTVASVVAAARRRCRVGALTRLTVRWRVRLASPEALWVLATIALAVVLPSVSLGALAHSSAAYPLAHAPCSVLLRHVHTP